MRYLLLILLCSCAPKGYVYKSGELKGVNYKKSVSPSEKKLIEVYALVVLAVIIKR